MDGRGNQIWIYWDDESEEKTIRVPPLNPFLDDSEVNTFSVGDNVEIRIEIGKLVDIQNPANPNDPNDTIDKTQHYYTTRI